MLFICIIEIKSNKQWSYCFGAFLVKTFKEYDNFCQRTFWCPFVSRERPLYVDSEQESSVLTYLTTIFKFYWLIKFIKQNSYYKVLSAKGTIRYKRGAMSTKGTIRYNRGTIR